MQIGNLFVKKATAVGLRVICLIQLGYSCKLWTWNFCQRVKRHSINRGNYQVDDDGKKNESNDTGWRIYDLSEERHSAASEGTRLDLVNVLTQD